MHIIKSLFISIVALCTTMNLSAQYKYKIIVDNNQIWQDELPQTSKLKCDGVWSIPGNSDSLKGRHIPIMEWKAGFDSLGQGFVVTEDYWRNFPAKNYDLTAMAVGKANIHLACGYAEPSLENDPHTSTVINNDVIDDIYAYAGVPVVVLSRAYKDNWKTEVTRALNNEKVAGVCYEQKPTVARYTQWNLVNGIKAVLAKNKKVFLLLPPQFSSESNTSTADIVNVFNHLKSLAPEVLSDSNLYFVPNCYNRKKDKETTFYGGENSVEGAIKKLKELRGDFNTTATTTPVAKAYKVYPTLISDRLNIATKENSNYDVEIYDITGKNIYKNTYNVSTTIVLPELKPGMFFIRIKTETGVETKTLIKQ